MPAIVRKLFRGIYSLIMCGVGRYSVGCVIATVMLAAVASLPIHAQQQSDGLKLPEDIAARSGQGDQESAAGRKLWIEERRVGGRLEQVTVHQSNGLDETFKNTGIDSMWVTEDKKLGETQNVRRWTIGSW